MRRTIAVAAFTILLHSAEASADVSTIPYFGIRIAPASEPVELLPGPHLFIDDYLVAESENLARSTHGPQRYEGNPILGWEKGTAQPYVTVVRDPETDLFRMWYDRDRGEQCALAYAESDDGIHWRTPKLGILGDDNRLLLVGYGASVIDDGPAISDKSRRFKLAWWSRNPGEHGMNIAFSPDGLRWTPWAANPVLPGYTDDLSADDPRWPYTVGDIIDVYWDPIRERYGVFLKTPAAASDGFAGGPRADRLIRRLVSASISDDFTRWKQPWRVLIPEPRDPGLLEFYAVGGTIARGSLLIGFVRMLHDDYACEPGGPSDGLGYATLVTSRDGVHWERHDDVFLDRSATPGAWDRAMAWIGYALPVGDELFLYYGGYKRGHKVEPTRERQLGLARMPRDRFVSRDATGKATGRLVTVPFKHESLDGRQLVLNADAREGEIRVRLLNQAGRTIVGADFQDTIPVRGDGLALTVPKLDLSLSGASPFRIEFALHGAKLFGFDIVSQ